MIRFRWQLLGHMLIVACTVFLLHAPAETIVTPSSFSTSTDMLLVSVALPQDSAPVVLSVDPLPTGRLTQTLGGPYRLALYSAENRLVESLAFQAPQGAHGHEQAAPELLFIVPATDVVRIQISGPTGMSEWQVMQ